MEGEIEGVHLEGFWGCDDEHWDSFHGGLSGP